MLRFHRKVRPRFKYFYTALSEGVGLKGRILASLFPDLALLFYRNLHLHIVLDEQKKHNISEVQKKLLKGQIFMATTKQP